jgi:hypothetical protein
MLDAGGGGGYAGTNWSATSVIDIWLAISNQDTTPHWQLLSGWRKSYELTLQHMAQVKNYRENLATAWPPEKSPAAAAYLARLDILIEHLQQTYDAAVANYQAFSTATSAISTARRELETVVNEYLANEGKLQTFAREQAERPKGGLQRGPEPKPPVADGQQVQLEAKARSIMYGLSSEISQARVQIKKPALYDPATRVDGGEADPAGTTYIPPAIPPVMPFTPEPMSSGGSSSVAVIGPQGTQSAHAAPAPTVRPPGLVLGGVDAPIAPPPPTVTPPVVGGPPPPSPVGPTSFPHVGFPGTLPQPQTTVRGVPGVGGLPPGGSMRAMPPGGVIGGAPGTGLSQPVGTRPPSAVNPIGGVINPASSATGRPANARSGAPGSTMAGMPLSRSSNANSEAATRSQWDPDNPWETLEGVTPVVTPSAEQRVDPGPAIGLH